MCLDGVHPLRKQSSELVVCALAERSNASTRGIVVRGMCSTGLRASLARGAPAELPSDHVVCICSSGLWVFVCECSLKHFYSRVSTQTHFFVRRRATARILGCVCKPCGLNSASVCQVLSMGVSF